MNDKNIYFRYKIDVLDALNTKKHINFYTCRGDGTFSQATLTKIKNGENISLNTACKICSILECQLSDIIEIVTPEENN